MEFVSLETLFLIAIYLAAGVVRGFTGGMGANAILAPLLALAVGPREAISIVILLWVSEIRLRVSLYRAARVNRRSPIPFERRRNRSSASSLGLSPGRAWARDSMWSTSRSKPAAKSRVNAGTPFAINASRP